MNTYLGGSWLAQWVCQLESSGDIGDDNMLLEDLLSQGFPTNRYIFICLVLLLGSSIMANAAMLSHLIFMMSSVVMVSCIRSLRFLAVLKEVLKASSSASADD